jgi:recombination protein U
MKSSHANRGKALEGALILAAREYERTGRASVFHRPTRKIWTQRGWVYPEKAGCDFVGNVDGTAITFEAKETKTDALPLANVKPHQIDALFANRKGISGLVVGFMKANPVEVYWVPYAALAEFLADKWRESLSLLWCRAYGELCWLEANAAGKLRVMFLDTRPHPDRSRARIEVADESYRATKPPLVVRVIEEKPHRRRDPARTADGKIDLLELAVKRGNAWRRKAGER